jgi:hypothetical protein
VKIINNFFIGSLKGKIRLDTKKGEKENLFNKKNHQTKQKRSKSQKKYNKEKIKKLEKY